MKEEGRKISVSKSVVTTLFYILDKQGKGEREEFWYIPQHSPAASTLNFQTIQVPTIPHPLTSKFLIFLLPYPPPPPCFLSIGFYLSPYLYQNHPPWPVGSSLHNTLASANCISFVAASASSKVIRTTFWSRTTQGNLSNKAPWLNC